MINGRTLTLQQEQARIDAARDFYLSRGKPVQVLESFELKPLPARTDRVDPETVLKRKPVRIIREQRRIFRQLAEAL